MDINRFFKLSRRKTTIRTELTAGVTTFFTLAYILAVNPAVLAGAGMDAGAVFTATALSSALATLVMALSANLPFALTPGVGINLFIANTVVLNMGHSWQFALTAVFVEGLIFIFMTFFNIREAIVYGIPASLKNAISVGLGLFIATIALKNAGLIASGASELLILGDITSPQALLLFTGLILTGSLLAFKVRGALLMGIIALTLLGVPLGITHYATGNWLPPSLGPTFWCFEFGEMFSLDFLMVLFTLLTVDIFDTVGTLIGCAVKAGMVHADGTISNCKEALFADAFGTTAGAIFGTSTISASIESSAGITEGGRTGLTALCTAVLLGLSLFLAPLFLSIPLVASAPALLMVGLSLFSSVQGINFNNPIEGIPAFLCILFMTFSSSVANGVMMGVVAHVGLYLVLGRFREIPLSMWIISLVFAIKVML